MRLKPVSIKKPKQRLSTYRGKTLEGLFLTHENTRELQKFVFFKSIPRKTKKPVNNFKSLQAQIDLVQCGSRIHIFALLRGQQDAKNPR